MSGTQAHVMHALNRKVSGIMSNGFNILTVHRHRLASITVSVIVFIWQPANVIADSEKSKTDITNQAQVNRGKLIHRRFCAACHGLKLEGQANWKKRNENGKLPAPPHDGTGHTWHHSDEVLFNIIKFGLVPPYAPENYKTDMPAWKDTLRDDDIWAVITFIKSIWPEELRQSQQQRN